MENDQTMSRVTLAICLFLSILAMCITTFECKKMDIGLEILKTQNIKITPDGKTYILSNKTMNNISAFPDLVK